MTLEASHPLNSQNTEQSLLFQALYGNVSDKIPVWFMRQAGRSLPEYRALRRGIPMLDACLDPQMATEITMQPIRRHNTDAAILFSDIVIPLKLAGIDVEIAAGVGPVFAEPITKLEQIRNLPRPSDVDFTTITQTVQMTTSELHKTPLIGFAGAPFTLAAYLVAGRPSKDYMAARSLMFGNPEAWDALLLWCADLTAAFLRTQILAGASAAQLFDSWAGALSPDTYRRHVAPYSARVFQTLADLPVPKVHFGTGTGELLPDMKATGADAMGIDYKIDLATASARLGHQTPLQGNLDPALLFAPWPVLQDHIMDVLRAGTSAPAHVFNLGHGVPPNAEPSVLTRVAEFVHSIDPREIRDDNTAQSASTN